MTETHWAVFTVMPGLSLAGVDETAVEVTFRRYDGHEPHSCSLYFVTIDERLECVGFAAGSTLGKTSLPFRPLDLASIRGVPWGRLIADGKAQAAAMPGVLRSVLGIEPLRPLTPAEEADARAAGEYLATVVSPALRVLASPYRRAQQTAQAVLLALPNKQLATVNWLTPDDDPIAVVAELAKLSATEVLLVSHQPLVSALAGLLVDGDYRAGPAMGTASLAEIELSALALGCGRLASLRHAPDYPASMR